MKEFIGEYLCDTDTATLIITYEYTRRYGTMHTTTITHIVKLYKTNKGNYFVMKREKPGKIFWRNPLWYLRIMTIDDIRGTLGEIDPDKFIEIFPQGYILH